MNLQEIKSDLPIQCEKNLSALYEIVCDEYRRRLCEMWEIPFDESWWMADRIGEGLFLCDWTIPLGLPMLRYIVENNVEQKHWIKWCDFFESEINDGKERPRINFYHWMRGLRPDMLNNEKEALPQDTEETH